MNEMASTGDTEISLHIRAPFTWGGEGFTPDQLKLRVPRSAFLGGGEWYSKPTFLKYLSGNFEPKISGNWNV